MWIPEDLGSPTPIALFVANSFRLNWLMARSFPKRMFHILGIFNFMGSLLHLGLHSHSCTHCPLRGFLPGLPNLPLKSRWKPSWPYNIQDAGKNSPTQMMLSSANSAGSSQPFFHYGFSSLCVPGWMRTVKRIPGNQFPKRLVLNKDPGYSVLKWKVYTFAPQTCDA